MVTKFVNGKWIKCSFGEIKANAVICGDWLKVCKLFKKNVFDLVISSPPYNLGKEYEIENDFDFTDYLEWHSLLLQGCMRVLKNGGRLAWQTGATRDGNNYFPLNSWVSMICLRIGFSQRVEIVWNKNQIPKRTAWGSFQSPSNNNILSNY